jgi:hypothetical protein
MATIYWLGTAAAVAKKYTVQITAYDAATTYKITVGSVVISVVGSGGTTTTVATALAAAWNASTNVYCTGITAAAVTDTITFTADTAGVDFTITSSVSAGTGTIGSATNTVANAGPNAWSTATNWSGGAVPVNSDDVVIKDSSVSICWGLAQSAVALTSLRIEKSYTGKIGLDRAVFATSADGATTVSTATEYRSTYLAIGASTVKIGENFINASVNGSSRILLDLGSATAANVEIHGTATSSSESGRPAVRLKAANASTGVYVRSTPGGVGVAVDAPGETSTVGTISISDTTTSSKVFCGPGVTLTTWYQLGGQNVLQAAATVTTVTVNGGTLQTEGDFTITTFNQNGGTTYCNHVKTAGNAITTLNLGGGTIDAQGSSRTRTWATANLNKGTLKADGSILTLTTINDLSGVYSLTVA